MSDSDFEMSDDGGGDDGGSDFEPDAGGILSDDDDMGSVAEEDDEDFAPPKKKARKKAPAKKKAAAKSPKAKPKAQKAAAKKATAKSPKRSQGSTSSTPKKTTGAKRKRGAAGSGAGSGAGAGAGAGAASRKKGATKVKAVSEKAAYQVLLDYLNTANKPYSAVNIFDNLHKAVKRAHVNRVLDKLAADGKIRRKCYKKFKLFYPDQSQFGDITPESVAALEQEVKDAEAVQQRTAVEKRKVFAERARLQAAPTDEELEKLLAETKAEVSALQERVDGIKGAGRSVDPAEKEKLKLKFKGYRKEWAARKRKVMDIVERMSEGMDKKPKDVIELLGLETDEECGVSYKACTL